MSVDLTQLFAAHPTPTLVVDQEGRVTAWNAAAEALTGRSAKDVLGQKAWKGFSDKRIRTPIEDAIEEASSLEEAFGFESRSGQKLLVTLRVNVLTSEEGKVKSAIISLSEPSGSSLDAVVRGALDNAAIAVMMVDRSATITYANRSVLQLMKTHEEVLRKQFPGFRADAIVGSSIDQFHKNPAHQRRLLSDPSHLPHRARIHVGPLVFDICASAVRSASGEYIGATLEWQDVTTFAKESSESKAKFEALNKSQAVVEFGLDGTILAANENFLKTVGYELGEIKGRHHRMLCDPSYASSHEYATFWEKLARGEFDAGEYRRIGKGGKEIWINASYNPILDMSGKLFKVVKFATNITKSKAANLKYREEVLRLYTAVKEGSLSVRGDVSAMDETYAPILAGINEIIEAATAPINEIQSQLARISEGDLTAYVEGNYKGDHAKLKDALNRTLDSLNQILAEVQGTATEIASGSSQVASAAQSLSDGATRQASAVEQITASITEMTEQTRQNAENATQASHLAIAAGEFASKGDERMKAMVKAMGEIEESSQSISKIIKVIDEIAFQTNLLALNAAVEAARAGSHGKGFAVVAEEVRNLAARSANAAKETTAMIEGSIRKVNQGTHIAEETASALTRIVESVTKATDLVAEIAAASNEQAQGIAQIDQGLRQVDQVTQQNTAGAEESAAASDELSSQASRLREMLLRFTLRRRGEGKMPHEASPELFAAFQAFLAQQGMSAPSQQASRGRSLQSAAPAPGRVARPRPGTQKSAPPKPSAPKSAPPKRVSSGVSPDPASIIPLDDDEFGRY